VYFDMLAFSYFFLIPSFPFDVNILFIPFIFLKNTHIYIFI
jgi:hypothetical protein